MSKQEQSEGFKLHSQNELQSLDSSRLPLASESESSKLSTPTGQQASRIRHVYLQQQNTYGRFVPYLLLKDQLQSQMDNSGHTALHHMCSHNSEYIPLYLSTLQKNDSILNEKSKLGHAPLDVAGIYCRKQYVQMLLEKGAIDNGNVDHWAIQGGNIYNWTGHVDTQKKYLIHWAAYNDMPQVLKEFYKQGASLSQRDANDFSPVDLAVINKSYKSFKALVQLGFRPKQQLVKQSESKSIRKILDQANESPKKKRTKSIMKLMFVPLFCLLSFVLMAFTNDDNDETNSNFVGINFSKQYIPQILTAFLWLVLTCFTKVEQQPRYMNSRYSAFHSDIIGCQVNQKSNHLLYYLLTFSITLTGVVTIFQSQTTSYLISLLYLLQVFITLIFIVNFLTLTYGIAKNLSHEEMFDSHKCKYLWKRIHYIDQRKMLVRKFNNPLNRGIKENFKRYFAKNFN